MPRPDLQSNQPLTPEQQKILDSIPVFTQLPPEHFLSIPRFNARLTTMSREPRHTPLPLPQVAHRLDDCGYLRWLATENISDTAKIRLIEIAMKLEGLEHIYMTLADLVDASRGTGNPG